MMCVSLLVCFGCLTLEGSIATPTNSQLQLPGNFSIAGLFPVHTRSSLVSIWPRIGACIMSKVNPHGYHLMQAMRFTVEQVNNKTSGQLRGLLPGVTLGYQMYDICSVPAGILATLDVLGQGALAVIGPDSSSNAFTPASLLGAYLVPQISYEASDELLSNKVLHPSFFRTIPSDRNQVAALVQLLLAFQWTWVGLLGSDNHYGLQGLSSLAEQAALSGVCVAYQAVIPALTLATVPTMRATVAGLLRAQVTAVVVFSSKTMWHDFLPFIVERNVTGKVWLATEDWSLAKVVAQVPGASSIGTVLGMALQQGALPGFQEFEALSTDARHPPSDVRGLSGNASAPCLKQVDLLGLSRMNFTLQEYDLTSSINVYKAVLAVAHALHGALGCNATACQETQLQPWQLLPWLRKVQFSMDNRSVHFDQSGDPPAGYDIVTWVWQGAQWSVQTVGSFSQDGVLTVNGSMVQWPGPETQNPVPLSVCSPQCPLGYRRVQTGQHKCCFDCMQCPAATFANDTGASWCQPCPPEQWAPAGSGACLERTVLLLAWDASLSCPLLALLGMTLLLLAGTALVFLRHMDTPVCRSAGGRTCLLMLLALGAAACSALCHWGVPSAVACALQGPLLCVGLAACLACVTVRALQVACIFRLAGRLPARYEAWARGGGPAATVGLLASAALLTSILRLALDPSRPATDLAFYDYASVLECSGTLSPGGGAEVLVVSLLSALCFALSYAGKELPANYSEAKCVAFSLLLHMLSWISFFTVYLVMRGPLATAARILAILYSVLGVWGGYFLPKLYIILLQPHMNTPAHFQNCIQMYTMHKQ